MDPESVRGVALAGVRQAEANLKEPGGDPAQELDALQRAWQQYAAAAQDKLSTFAAGLRQLTAKVAEMQSKLNTRQGSSGFGALGFGAHPIYTYYDLRDGRRVETSRRFLRDGKLVTEAF